MKRSSTALVPALVPALATVAGVWLARAGHSGGAAIALGLAPLLAEAIARAGSGLRWPSPGALILSGALAVASTLLLARGPDHLAEMIPVLGAAAAASSIAVVPNRRRPCPRGGSRTP